MKSATRKSRRKNDPPSRRHASDRRQRRMMALRVQLMMRLSERVQEKGYTQIEAAKRLGMTQPRVSALLKGSWKDFSMDMLLTLATRAGLKPELHLAAAEKRRAV